MNACGSITSRKESMMGTTHETFRANTSSDLRRSFAVWSRIVRVRSTPSRCARKAMPLSRSYTSPISGMASLAPLITEANTDNDCENGVLWASTSILARSKYDLATGSVRSACRRTTAMMCSTSGESTIWPSFWPCRSSPVMDVDGASAPISNVWPGRNRGPVPLLTSSTAARPKVLEDMNFAVVSEARALAWPGSSSTVIFCLLYPADSSVFTEPIVRPRNFTSAPGVSPSPIASATMVSLKVSA